MSKNANTTQREATSDIPRSLESAGKIKGAIEPARAVSNVPTETTNRIGQGQNLESRGELSDVAGMDVNPYRTLTLFRACYKI